MPQFWKVRNILFWAGRVLQNSPQKLGECPPHSLSPPELTWGFPYARGLWYHLPFRGPIILTHYNFYAHVQYCITIHYHSYSIDKYRNVEGSKMPQFWKVRNIQFWEGRILQNSPQKLGEFLPYSFSHLSWFEIPPMLGVCDICTFQGTYQIDKL